MSLFTVLAGIIGASFVAIQFGQEFASLGFLFAGVAVASVLFFFVQNWTFTD